MTTPLLSIQDIHCGYHRDTTILNGINLTVQVGELVAIVGANGAGKSTVMKAVFGFLKIFRGEIYYYGQSITGLPSDQIARLGISYVPQVNNVFTDLSIEDNLQMGAFTCAHQLTHSLAMVYDFFPDLVAKRKQLAGGLSGGQRQMLAMARALMVQPKLLLLDEPTAGLSPKYMKQIFTIIQQIRQQHIGILLVEQHAKQALMACDRAYVLSMGTNRNEGTGEELLSDADVVASFLGG